MVHSDEIRWQQRWANFSKALAQLEAACDLETYSDLERAGLVQMFEFSFELAWKTLKDLLYYQGIQAPTPREALRAAFEAGLLGEGDCAVLLDALAKRNLLSHTYEERTAQEAVGLIRERYTPTLSRLREELRRRLPAQDLPLP